MAKFWEVPRARQQGPIAMNLDHVVKIEPTAKGGSRITLIGEHGTVECDFDYEAAIVLMKAANAQGT